MLQDAYTEAAGAPNYSSTYDTHKVLYISVSWGWGRKTARMTPKSRKNREELKESRSEGNICDSYHPVEKTTKMWSKCDPFLIIIKSGGKELIKADGNTVKVSHAVSKNASWKLWKLRNIGHLWFKSSQLEHCGTHWEVLLSGEYIILQNLAFNELLIKN